MDGDVQDSLSIAKYFSSFSQAGLDWGHDRRSHCAVRPGRCRRRCRRAGHDEKITWQQRFRFTGT